MITRRRSTYRAREAVQTNRATSQGLLACGARVDRLHGRASGRVVLDVHYAALGGGAAFGIGVHRAALFGLLHDAVTAEGVPVETGCAISGSVPVAGSRRRLLLADGRSAGPFDLIVDALGTRTPLAPPAGRKLLTARCGRASTGRTARVSTLRRWSSGTARRA